MRNFINKYININCWIVIASIVLGVSCRQTNTTPPADFSQMPSDSFELTEKLLTNFNPFEIYAQAIVAFRFYSKTTLSYPDRETVNPASAETTLEQIGNQYLHITRYPFTPVPSVEILQQHGLTYLKPHQEKTFYQIKKNYELSTLQKTIFSEVLTYFDLDLYQSQPATKQDQQTCYQKDSSKLCFDQVSNLPVYGYFKQDQSDGAVLTIVFEVTPLDEDFIRLEPNKIHSLRYTL